MGDVEIGDLRQLQRLADEISAFRLYLKIYFAGILTTFVLGQTLTMIFLFIYLFYEFNIYEGMYRQIPVDLRNKYNSKILVTIKWLDKIATEALLKEVAKEALAKEASKDLIDREE